MKLIYSFIAAGFLFIILFTPISDAEEQAQPMPKKITMDTNKDGKPDRWEMYKDGKIEKLETDSNYDGVVDEIGYFKDGKIVKIEKDADFDGKMDRWIEY